MSYVSIYMKCPEWQVHRAGIDEWVLRQGERNGVTAAGCGASFRGDETAWN